MNPLQRAATIRKASYLAAIVVLFTVSMIWRGTIPVPLGTSTASAAQPFRWLANHTIQSQAQRLELWDLDPNETEVEVSGSAVRLALTGSRGFVVTALWLSAIEKQKRNDFHEFQDRVRWVTKLQPNFVTPWIFQSWNIAYNVSVEMQGSGDMYYYIVRGIQLLAEGERRNKRSPDMRYQIAFYYQNKFGVADNVETLRCLFDLSCMPPSERNPDNLRRPSDDNPNVKVVDREAFRRFCEKHPHFVRRVRGKDNVSMDARQAAEKLRAPTPEDVIQFLEANYKELPCRYRKDAKGNWTDELADPEPDKYFPVLPPRFNEGPDEAHPEIATPDDASSPGGYFSAFKVARAWFTYSLVLLPPPLKDERGEPIPGPTPPPGVGGHDPSKHRIPRLPMMIIFRQGAPRAQSYAAEVEQKEGWFDNEGWRIDDPLDRPDEWWFPDATRSRPLDVVVGTERQWSYEEWQRAAEMWTRHGKANAMSLDAEQLQRLRELAGDQSPLPPTMSFEQISDPNLRRRVMAATALQYYQTNRSVTNFGYFLHAAEAEAYTVNGRPITVQARKLLWQAERAKTEPMKAIRLYQEGLKLWKEVLDKNPKFHRLPPPDRGDRTEEETYEYELGYFRLLVQHDPRVLERANQIAHTASGLIPFLTEPFVKDNADAIDPLWPSANKEEIKWFVVENVGDAEFSSPFVGSLTRDGTPWIREEIKEMVRSRQGVGRAGRTPTPEGSEDQPNR
jgi:hypothetical protein